MWSDEIREYAIIRKFRKYARHAADFCSSHLASQTSKYRVIDFAISLCWHYVTYSFKKPILQAANTDLFNNSELGTSGIF